jgi:hypothetical protein
MQMSGIQWCDSARLVRDALAVEDGAVPNGEQDPNLGAMLAQHEWEAPGQAGLGCILVNSQFHRTSGRLGCQSSGSSGVRR